MFQFTEPSSGQVSEPKHVTKFLILITNICCVTDWKNYCITVQTQQDDSYQNVLHSWGRISCSCIL